MLRIIFAVIRFSIYLIHSLPAQRKAKRLDREGNIAARDAIVNDQVPDWARFVVGLTGGTVEVTGEELIPQDTAVVFVANHQGNLDIPILLGYIRKPKAFVAKIEILKTPILATWMKLMQCTFLDRKNMRQSVRAMHEAADTVKNGYSIVIFPEGTRSKGGPVGEFKAGSFKIALKAGVPIVPVTVDGSWHLFEETGRIKKAHVRITVHPAISTANLSHEESLAIPEKVRAAVMSGFTK